VVLLALLEVSQKESKAVKSFYSLFAIAVAHYYNPDLHNSSIVVHLAMLKPFINKESLLICTYIACLHNMAYLS
jgi:hypothetical protein